MTDSADEVLHGHANCCCPPHLASAHLMQYRQSQEEAQAQVHDEICAAQGSLCRVQAVLPAAAVAVAAPA